MKYFITGGSGFLGINLISFLQELDHEVINYDFAEFDYPEKNTVKSYQKDIRDWGDIDHAIKESKPDVVVHCAAALPLYSEEDIYSTDIDGSQNVIKASKAHGVNRFIHISSTAVYGVPDHHPLVEDDKLDGVGAYGIAKIKAEEICREARDEDFDVTVIRPKTFIGPERLGVFAMLYDWAIDGHNFPILGKGNNRYQLMDVEDLCHAIYLASKAEKDIANETYNIGAEKFTTFKEDLQAVLDEAGHNKHIIGIPAWPAIFVLRILEKLNLSPLYKWVYDTASKDSFVSINKAKKKLGYNPKYSNKDALLRNFEWYKENKDSFNKQSGVSHRVPWNQKALGIVKKFF